MHNPRFEHGMGQNAQFTFPSFNWPRARSVNRLISLVTVCSSYLAENASGWGRGWLLRTGRLIERGLGRSTDILKKFFRRMSVIQTKQGIFDISQHIQRFIWRYPGLLFIPLLQMWACFWGKSVTSLCLACQKQAKLKKTKIKLMATLYCKTSVCSLIFSSLIFL